MSEAELLEPTREELSTRNMICKLEVGESHTLSTRLSFGVSQEDVDKAAKALHDIARAAMGRAKKQYPARTFTGESGFWYTSRGRHPVVCYLVTRIK